MFSSAVGAKEEIETDVRMGELVEKLNALKQNLEDEKRLILETHAAMSDVLTPKYVHFNFILFIFVFLFWY